jgi:hypothetical protein
LHRPLTVIFNRQSDELADVDSSFIKAKKARILSLRRFGSVPVYCVSIGQCFYFFAQSGPCTLLWRSKLWIVYQVTYKPVKTSSPFLSNFRVTLFEQFLSFSRTVDLGSAPVSRASFDRCLLSGDQTGPYMLLWGYKLRIVYI